MRSDMARLRPRVFWVWQNDAVPDTFLRDFIRERAKTDDPSLTKAGGREVVAECPDSSDCTDSLQAAIDTPHASLVRVPVLPGGEPWIVGDRWKWDYDSHGIPHMTAALHFGAAASNRTIVFEPGVEVLAKEGDFHSGELVHMTNVSRLKIIAYGATWAMRKSDYQHSDKYSPGDSRHALAMHGSTDVSIIGLAIRSSGGDGIYLRGSLGGNDGLVTNSCRTECTPICARTCAPTPAVPQAYCRNILIKDVVSDDHTRNSMSVISVIGLTVINSTFSSTCCMPPSAGLDFEPNTVQDRLSSILLSSVSVLNNTGNGIDLPTDRLAAPNELGNVKFPAAMLTLRIRDLLIDGGGRGGLWWDDSLASGFVSIDTATIRNLPKAAIMMELTASNLHHIDLRNVAIEAVATDYAAWQSRCTNCPANYSSLPPWTGKSSSSLDGFLRSEQGASVPLSRSHESDRAGRPQVRHEHLRPLHRRDGIRQRLYRGLAGPAVRKLCSARGVVGRRGYHRVCLRAQPLRLPACAGQCDGECCA